MKYFIDLEGETIVLHNVRYESPNPVKWWQLLRRFRQWRTLRLLMRKR